MGRPGVGTLVSSIFRGGSKAAPKAAARGTSKAASAAVRPPAPRAPHSTPVVVAKPSAVGDNLSAAVKFGVGGAAVTGTMLTGAHIIEDWTNNLAQTAKDLYTPVDKALGNLAEDLAMLGQQASDAITAPFHSPLASAITLTVGALGVYAAYEFYTHKLF